MATITPGLMTYAEWALRMDETGKTSTLVNLLSQNNGILADALTLECSSGNVYEYTQVVKLPTVGRRSYNAGVPASLAGVAKQVTTAVEYADWSKIDKSLGQLGGNLAELRANEDALHMEALSQTVASDMFYANRATDPTAFTGLANIYNTVSTATSAIANNVIDLGGTGSVNTSMWMVTWGPKHIHTIFPKGIPAGMQHQDMGLLPSVDANGNEFLAYRTWLQMNIGLAIHDWRFAVRACNIDVPALSTASPANLINALSRMMMKMPVQPVGVGPIQTSDSPGNMAVQLARTVIYCNRTVYLALDQQAQNKTNLFLRMTEWDGQAVLTYRGIPIRIVDAILNTESRVV